MPALWPTFIPAVGNYLNSTSSKKTHDEIAEKIASEYHKAVKTANTLVHPGNMPLVLGYMPSPSAPKPYTPIKNAIKKTLDDIKKSEGRPKHQPIGCKLKCPQHHFTQLILDYQLERWEYLHR
jgi:hypothetical protein